jgi:murein DD-endopeptidase MepM/ murein hydrolase activator NlpD
VDRPPTRRWLACALAALALGIAACGSGSDDQELRGAQPGHASEAAALDAAPSAFARRTLEADEIRTYRRTAEELGLDWSVLAAADQLEGSASAAEGAERVAAVGYTLQSFGAPEDYRTALEARLGTAAGAARVLRLAERYRSLEAARVPPAKRPLRVPADGPVIAPFGQRLGVLHDGIDIDAPTGAPVRAAAAGLVITTGFHRIFGEYTCVLHRFERGPAAERELTTCYGNQSAYRVEPGDPVAAGERIGDIGCTGTCIRPHLHFQVRLGAGQTSPVTDPLPFLSGEPAVSGGKPLESG